MKNKKIQMITIDAFFISIIAILSFLWGYIPLSIASFTIVMIPVLIGAYLFGFKRGIIYGFAFGFMSLLRAATLPSGILDPYFVNPIVSILPRLLFGIAAGMLMPLIRRIIKDVRLKVITLAVAAFVLTLFHSVATLGILGICNGSEIGNLPELTEVNSYWALMGSILVANGLIEGAIAAGVVPTVVIALERYLLFQVKNNKGKNYRLVNQVNQREAIENLQKWINIPSLDDPKTSNTNMPFGQEVYNALQFIGKLAEQDGFAVDYCDGYCTEITLGNGPKQIAIYAHADVVPATGNWTYPPFEARIENDIMYGRGTSDDKGPAMAAYYALKALKATDAINKKYRVSLVIGGNEEKGSKCLHYYFQELHKPYPEYGFTPDGQFPLIYGEKGISNYQSTKEIDLGDVISIDAGVAFNSVIDKASAKILKNDLLEPLLKTKKVTYELKHDETYSYLNIVGKSAHGSTPEVGINAGIILLELLSDLYQNKFLKKLAHMYKDPSGKNMDLCFKTALLHESTYNVGVINYENKTLTISVNFRYPEGVVVSEVIHKINKTLEMETTLLRDSEPLLIDPNSSLVTTLLKTYQEETNDYQTPIVTIGGGTYARESKNTLAFGSAFPNRKDNIHEADENIHLSDFTKSMDIYASAVVALSKL